MIKTLVNQVKVVTEVLKKTPDEPATPSSGLSKEQLGAMREANTAHMSEQFKKMSEHTANGNHAEAEKIGAALKSHILSSPKGSIDVGKLDKMRKTSQHQSSEGTIRVNNKFMRGSDMNDVINHHLGDIKSIKDAYDNHGGIDTVEALCRTMGANGDTREYSSLKFKNPNVHMDLLDMVNPGKATYERQQFKHEGVLQGTYMNRTPIDKDLHNRVEDSWKNMREENEDGESFSNDSMRAHEDAVVARGLERFKRHHGIYDKVADLKSGGSLHYGTRGNYEVKHPQGNMHVWHDDRANNASYNQYREDNEDGSGFPDDIATSKPIQDHIDEAIAAIKAHRKVAKY